MLFHAGAILRLDELGLLSRLERVAAVSGGAITAGVLARAWKRLGTPDESGVLGGVREHLLEPLLSFSCRWVDVRAGLQLLRFRSVGDAVVRSYDTHLFQGATLQDLPASPAPQFVFCATNLQTGVLWRFTRDYAGDYLVGRMDRPGTLLATAVAASSAFPPFLSPLRLSPAPGSFTDWPSSDQPPLPDIEDYRRQVVLTDGGAYDNHGLEPVLKRFMTVFASDGGAPFARRGAVGSTWFGQLRRVLEVEDSQVRALRRRDLIGRYAAARAMSERGELPPDGVAPHARFGAYWGIATSPRGMEPPDCLPCDPSVVEPLARIGTQLRPLGAQSGERLVNWGYAICDRSIRTHYRGGLPLNGSEPRWPFPSLPLG